MGVARWLLLLVPFAMGSALVIGRARLLDKRQERRFEARMGRRREAYFAGDLLDSKGAAHDEWDQRRRASQSGSDSADPSSPLEGA
jgi:hypothetical protein